ncbi:MAG: CRISPR-associated endoribonuclease Cas6 [Myxacorys californica WJT36-NPBG1]|jgi:CRISPR-associated endoribonuclease Cas6|nr:CRISPR-associated endoribonuclease Cas6 [Myxacorys californica WJT36-NPBG1]
MELTLSLPHLEATALQTLVIKLGAAGNGDFSLSCSRALHAQVLKWFQLGQPQISQAIHDSQESPISLSGLMGKRFGRVVQEGDEFYFRVGLLNGNLLEPLLKGLEQWESQVVLLSKFPFVIKDINMLPGSHFLVGSSDYTLLAQMPSDAKALTLRFLSPTSFKLAQNRYIQPVPLPDSVFGSLQRRWNTFAPKELRFPKTQWAGLICDFEIKSQRLNLDRTVELGSVGWVRYQFPDLQQARIANVLAHFAFFSGVGRKTAMGMGLTLLKGTTPS